MFSLLGDSNYFPCTDPAWGLMGFSITILMEELQFQPSASMDYFGPHTEQARLGMRKGPVT